MMHVVSLYFVNNYMLDALHGNQDLLMGQPSLNKTPAQAFNAAAIRK